MGDVRLIRMCKCSELFCKVQFVLCFNPNRSLCRLSIILGCFHLFPVGLLFACGTSCLPYSLDVARYAFKNKTAKMLHKQTKPKRL